MDGVKHAQPSILGSLQCIILPSQSTYLVRSLCLIDVLLPQRLKINNVTRFHLGSGFYKAGVLICLFLFLAFFFFWRSPFPILKDKIRTYMLKNSHPNSHLIFACIRRQTRWESRAPFASWDPQRGCTVLLGEWPGKAPSFLQAGSS